MDRFSKAFIDFVTFLYSPLARIQKIKSEWFACLESWDWDCFSKKDPARNRGRKRNPNLSPK